jgi:hypothetical protein
MSRYNEEIQRYIGDACQEELLVLIWGPGDPGESGSLEAKEGYRKRCLIRDALRESFPRSEVEFSEDLDTSNLTDLLLTEAVQAKVSDAVIILPISHGAYFELYYYSSKYEWFLEKAWVLAPQEYLDTTGFAGELLKLLPKKFGYTAEQFERSDTTKISLDIATAVATAKRLQS